MAQHGWFGGRINNALPLLTCGWFALIAGCGGRSIEDSYAGAGAGGASAGAGNSAAGSSTAGSSAGAYTAGAPNIGVTDPPPSDMDAGPPTPVDGGFIGDPGPSADCIGVNGQVMIASQADVDRLAGCTVLSGVSIYHVTDPLIINWPVLRVINGMFYADHCDALQSVSMPALESIGAELYLDSDTSLQVLSMPSLTTIYGNQENGNGVYLANNRMLSKLYVPKLSRIGGYAYVVGNTQLCFGLQPDWPSLTDNNQRDYIVQDACGSRE